MLHPAALALAALLFGAALKPAGVSCTPEVFQTEIDSTVSVVHAEFTIKNTFDSNAHVTDIIPSCSCLTVAPFKHDIPSGGEVHVLVDVDIAGHDGTLIKDVELDLAGVPQKNVMLSITISRK